MDVLIELCETNEARRLAARMEQEFPEARIVIYPCLARCAGCYLALFAWVDGILVEAYAEELLLEGIRAAAER